MKKRVRNSVNFLPKTSAAVPRLTAPTRTPPMKALIVVGRNHSLSHTSENSDTRELSPSPLAPSVKDRLPQLSGRGD